MEMVELVTRRRKVRYEHVRNFLRRMNHSKYGTSHFGYEDAYVGDGMWIFKNGYAVRFLRDYGKHIFTLGIWNDDGSVDFSDGPGYVRVIKDTNDGVHALGNVSKGNIHLF